MRTPEGMLYKEDRVEGINGKASLKVTIQAVILRSS
jgi:hypothetical protein